MTMGRPRKPTALHLLEGTSHPGRLPKAEPKPKPVKPKLPSYLGLDGRRHWNDLAGKLERMGVLTEVDQDVLGLYCDAFDRWRKAERAIRREGEVISMGEKGYRAPNPWLQVRNRALDDLRRWAPELGIGAASRSRIEVKKADGAENPLKDIQDAANAEAASRRRSG